MYIGLHVKYPLFLSYYKVNYIFLDRFSKNIQISNFMKIHQVGTESFHAEVQKDGQIFSKLIVAVCNFAKAPKKGKRKLYHKVISCLNSHV